MVLEKAPLALRCHQRLVHADRDSTVVVGSTLRKEDAQGLRALVVPYGLQVGRFDLDQVHLYLLSYQQLMDL